MMALGWDWGQDACRNLRSYRSVDDFGKNVRFICAADNDKHGFCAHMVPMPMV